MNLANCHNFHDFRLLAKKKLPSPIFNYIDGAAEDERTYRRNTASFDTVDLVPNVLNGTEEIDMSVEVMGQKLKMPIYCSPTALQKLFTDIAPKYTKRNGGYTRVLKYGNRKGDNSPISIISFV